MLAGLRLRLASQLPAGCGSRPPLPSRVPARLRPSNVGRSRRYIRAAFLARGNDATRRPSPQVCSDNPCQLGDNSRHQAGELVETLA